MPNTRTKSSILNIVFITCRKLSGVLFAFISRTVFIHLLSSDYLGLDGLFSNIMSILSLSELGLGSAILFYLYEPIAREDNDRIRSIMRLYKISYWIVGIVIFLLGLVVIPFLPLIIDLQSGLPEHLILIYMLYVLNSASTYFFLAYKQAIFVGNQKQYYVERFNILFSMLGCLCDVIVLMLLREYIGYLIGKILISICKNLTISLYADKQYPYLKSKSRIKVNVDDIKRFGVDLKRVFVFRFGSTLFNTTDNIIISILLGTVVVGYYSNYFLIFSQSISVIAMLSQAMAASVGNLIVKEDRSHQLSIYRELNMFMYIIVLLAMSVLFSLTNPLVRLWIGDVDDHYILSQTVVLILCINFYFDGTTKIMDLYRIGSGHFEIGSTLQIIGGIFNIIMSIVLGKLFGLEGILCATIISKGFITTIPFIYNIGEVVFQGMGLAFLYDYLKKGLVSMLIVAVCYGINRLFFVDGILGLILQLLIALSISTICVYVIFRRDEGVALFLIRVKRNMVRNNGMNK